MKDHGHHRNNYYNKLPTVINQVSTNQSRVIFPPEKDNEAGISSASPLKE